MISVISNQQLATLLGLGVGVGAILLFAELVGRTTRQPHLVDTAERLTGLAAIASAVLGEPAGTNRHVDRLGRLVLSRGTGLSLLHIPHSDLALVRKNVASFVGERVIWALVGLALPSAITVAMAFGGFAPPFAVPFGLGIVLAFVLSYVPAYTVRNLARTKRAEFRRAMTMYIDLVALERAAGSGATQALESAARIGESWSFQRLRDELAHARWAGTAAWEALRALGDELRLPELTETAAVMRMSAREGATVYDLLRSRAAAMRGEILAADQAQAGSRTERATVPMAATAVVFMLILATPVAMQIG